MTIVSVAENAVKKGNVSKVGTNIEIIHSYLMIKNMKIKCAKLYFIYGLVIGLSECRFDKDCPNEQICNLGECQIPKGKILCDFIIFLMSLKI